MTVKVIGAGVGRTGTLSMKAALEELGFAPCHHMFEVVDSAEQAAMWRQVADGENPGWNEVLGGFQSVVDFPGCIFTEELAKAYPDAKVVLTVRDPDSWFRSASETIAATRGIDVSWLYPIAPKFRDLKHMQDKLIWNGFFKGRFDEPAFAKARVEEHNQRMRDAFGDRLLVMHVSEGWEPLCAHLGVPVPDTPFPNVNDTAQFKDELKKMRMAARAPYVLGGILLAALAAWFVF